MKTYPIMLDVNGKKAVVVGGGPVGLRKARSLCEAGAAVRLITLAGPPPGAPGAWGQAQDAGELAGITVINEAYRGELLEGAMLVLACTDDRPLNARVAADARSIGALVNVADRPDQCDFFAPAAVSRGDVVVAVGTGGSAPALAARSQQRSDQILPERLGEFAAALAHISRDLKAEHRQPERRRQIMKDIAGRESYDAFLAGGADALRKRLKELTGG